MDIYKCPISEMSKNFPEKNTRCDHKIFLRSHDQKNVENFVTIIFFEKRFFPFLDIFGFSFLATQKTKKNDKNILTNNSLCIIV